MIAVSYNWDQTSQILFGTSDTTLYTGNLTSHNSSITQPNYWAIQSQTYYGDDQISAEATQAIFSTSTGMILLP